MSSLGVRIALPFVLALPGILARPTPAHAIAACNNNEGFAPAFATTVPPHAKLVFYTDSRNTPEFTAKIAGKKVPVKVTALPSGSSTRVTLLEIDSERVGTLQLDAGGWPSVTLTVAKKARMPKEVPVVIGRFERNIPHSTVRENFLGLAIRLPKGTPAVAATVKLRRDAQAAWTELVVPVSARDFDDARPVIRIGELGCSNNYSVPLLESGVDIEVTLMLADGTTRPAKDLAPHVTLPAALPAQPTAPKRRP